MRFAAATGTSSHERGNLQRRIVAVTVVLSVATVVAAIATLVTAAKP